MSRQPIRLSRDLSENRSLNEILKLLGYTRRRITARNGLSSSEILRDGVHAFTGGAYDVLDWLFHTDQIDIDRAPREYCLTCDGPCLKTAAAPRAEVAA